VQAKLILRKHGWRDSDGDGVLDRDGVPFEFDMITNHSSQQRVDIVTMAEAYLKKIGVKVNVHTLEFGVFIKKVMSSEFDSCVLGWKTATKPDITNLWHSTAVRPAGYNISSYQNSEVDSLIDQAKVTLDSKAAGALWSQVQKIIYRDQPFTFIAIPYEVNALHSRFCDVEPNAISFFANLRDWRLCDQR
jgi:peptide/nickel transport system substrate-binding protein